jgi:hypothetical protein
VDGGFAAKYASNPGRWEKLVSFARTQADSDVKKGRGQQDHGVS